ncbi:MAG TPA: hypothetical protein VM889_11400 [Candidatus Thermoplasmatota archaeon]|nr:hypothetical protein [Candidatus Thermoplasmatota archaeon]
MRRATPSARTRAALLALVFIAPGLLASVAAQTPGGGAVVPVQVPVDRTGGPDLRVFSPFGSIPASSRATVLFAVDNAGPGEVRNVVAAFTTAPEVTPGQGVLLVGADGIRNLGTIEEDRSKLVGVTLATPSAPGGARLIVTLTYDDAGGTRRTTVREVAVLVGPPEDDILRIEHRSPALSAGSEETLRFLVSNPSDERIADLGLVLDVAGATFPTGQSGAAGATPATTFPGGFPTTTNLVFPADGGDILRDETLAPGQEVAVDGRVLVGLAAPDVFPFSVTATYVVDGVARSQRFDFAARIAPSVKFRLLEVREETAGDGLVLTGTLVNVGTGSAWNPRVRVPEGTAYEATEPKLVEDLEANEPVGFRIATSRAREARPESAIVEVEWNDDFGNVRTTPVEGEPKLLPPPAAQPAILQAVQSPWLWTLVLGALLLAVVAALAWRHPEALRLRRGKGA